MSEKNIVPDMNQLLATLQIWGKELGFQKIGVSDINLQHAEIEMLQWLEKKFHGEMNYMERHGIKRSRPELLVTGTIRVITARMDYWPESAAEPWEVLDDSSKAFISRYALGRDYHKMMRKRLLSLAKRLESVVDTLSYRVFCDSAPVLEKAIAEKSGLGWIGKHSNVLNREHGSYFFLGEIFTDIPLPVTEPISDHCGSCVACIDICPTQAIVAPYQVDARRCISYLTIELRGSIPVEFRPLMGNRIYGCDDCQLVCPWNKFAQATGESDYLPRNNLDSPQLLDLFSWTEQQFLTRLEGSPIRRIGYESWLRNIAVALGNADNHPDVISALQSRLDYPSELVQEHVRWALEQHDLNLSE